MGGREAGGAGGFPAGWKPAFQDGQDGHPPTRPERQDRAAIRIFVPRIKTSEVAVRDASYFQDACQHGEWQDAGSRGGELDVLGPAMHLIEEWDVGAGGEVGDVPAEVALAGLAFHGEDRLAVPHDDEVDFPAGGVAQKAQTHGFAFGVFEVMARRIGRSARCMRAVLGMHKFESSRKTT